MDVKWFFESMDAPVQDTANELIRRVLAMTNEELLPFGEALNKEILREDTEKKQAWLREVSAEAHGHEGYRNRLRDAVIYRKKLQQAEAEEPEVKSEESHEDEEDEYV